MRAETHGDSSARNSSVSRLDQHASVPRVNDLLDRVSILWRTEQHGRWKGAQSPGDGAEFAVDVVVFCMGGHSGFGLRLLEETDDLSALLSTANDPRVSSSSEALWLVSKLHAGGDD